MSSLDYLYIDNNINNIDSMGLKKERLKIPIQPGYWIYVFVVFDCEYPGLNIEYVTHVDSGWLRVAGVGIIGRVFSVIIPDELKVINCCDKQKKGQIVERTLHVEIFKSFGFGGGFGPLGLDMGGELGPYPVKETTITLTCIDPRKVASRRQSAACMSDFKEDCCGEWYE